MKHKEDSPILEKPKFTIEDDNNNASSQEILEEPIITIERTDDTADTDSLAPLNKRSRLPKWGMGIIWFVATVIIVFGCYGAIRLYNYYYNIGVSIIETPHPETLWDFADALREYGYVDAVYLTGGNESGFYRAPDGTAYFTERAVKYRTDKHHGVAPWLVLRKR